MKTVIAGFLSCVFLFTSPAAAQRLAGTTVPEHYDLWFAPDLQRETFRGRATIAVRVAAPTRAITLHAAEIAFTEVTVVAGTLEQRAQVTTDAQAETATFTIPREVPAGAVRLQIVYTGVLNDKLRGFYISRAAGRKYAITQMEPTDARRAFPSFDEPIYKATFDISLMVDTGDTAISNGRQLSDKPGPERGKHTVMFARTQTMSTYLVAMLVGDFVCRSGASDGTPIRVCATPGKRSLTAFALQAAEQQLRFFNQYFGVRYPFGKLDIIGVPDFAAGAMENAGAITFRERLLLVDPQRASVGTQKSVASVLAHEIAHQWFGNLVTMKWWDDIWLNEGFATWMANKPLAAWRPDWHVDLMDAEDTQSALALDALRSTRAIRARAETTEEINELFDGIAYEKTAAVLRMIEAYVGPEPFRQGITSYLRKFSYANAAGEDFWSEMTRVTGRPIDRILKSYVDQAGAPVLSVTSTCSAGRTEFSVAQRRFVATLDAAPPAPQTWTLPACVKTATGPPHCEMIERPAQTFSAPDCSVPFANADARGYYFSEYTPATVRGFAANLGAFKPVERLSLLGDEWWLVLAARHEIGGYLDLAAAMVSDETPAVVDGIATRLTYTSNYIAPATHRAMFEAWVRGRFEPGLRSLGLPGDARDSDDRQSRRATLLSLVGFVGNDASVQRTARDLAERYMAAPSALSPTLAPVVLQVAALGGDVALFDTYLAQLGKLGNEPEQYYTYFNALSWFRDPMVVDRALDYAFSPAVRTQDTGTLVAGLLARRWAQDRAWEQTKDRWDALTKKLGTFQGIPTIVTALGSFCSRERAAEVRQFFASHPVPSAERTLQRAIERIETCAAVADKQSSAFVNWIAAAR